MNKKKLIFSSGIANSFEWYNYALFGHLASTLSDKFFPDEDPSIQILNGFLLFAVGYIVRPLGGIIFGIIGDKIGRKKALTASIMCMAYPTALISVLPSYESVGIIATILMIFIRMLQGLSMGGALTGSVSFLMEHTEKEKRGLLGSVPMASISVGILSGSLITFLIKLNLNDADFESWGWRIPFFLGIFIIFAAKYINNHMDETPQFEELQENNNILKSPLKKALKSNWRDILVSIAINSTGSVLFYMQAIYMVNYLDLERGLSEIDLSYIINISYIVIMISTIFSGWLSDIIGRVKLYRIMLCCIALTTFSLLTLIENGNLSDIWIAELFMAILAGMYIGAEPVLQAELFPTNIRNTALSVSYNISTSLFGGLTPYLLQLLLIKTGYLTSGAYYLTGCAFFSFIALYFYKDRSEE